MNQQYTIHVGNTRRVEHFLQVCLEFVSLILPNGVGKMLRMSCFFIFGELNIFIPAHALSPSIQT